MTILNRKFIHVVELFVQTYACLLCIDCSRLQAINIFKLLLSRMASFVAFSITMSKDFNNVGEFRFQTPLSLM